MDNIAGGQVWCVVQGELSKLTQWVNAHPHRYVVWINPTEAVHHPRIYATQAHELELQQIVTDLVYLPFIYDAPSHPLLQKLARLQTEAHYRSSDFADQGMKLLTNYRSNLHHPTRRAMDCFGRLSQFPAIVCGAGPSLNGVIPFLKQHSDHFLIIGAGAGMQALLAGGIEPHLAVHVDPNPYHRFSPTKIPLFYQLRTSPEVVSQMRGPRFLMEGTGEFLLEQWIEEKLGIETSSDGGWTAATRATALASHLGCKAIYFAGLDFRTGDELYAKGVSAPVSGASKASQASPEWTKISLPDGSVIQTRPDWLLAAEWLNTWCMRHSDISTAFVFKANPLLPNIPAIHLEGNKGKTGVRHAVKALVEICPEVQGEETWKTVSKSFKHCQTLVNQFLAHFQKIFPHSPSTDGKCQAILQEIDQQEIVRIVLDPIWTYWEKVLGRQPENHPDSLIIHRLLLLKSLADQFYV